VETFQIALAVGFLVFIAILLTFCGLFSKRLNLIERLKARGIKNGDEAGFGYYKRRLEQFLLPIGEMLPRSPAEMSRQERRLVQAGIRRKDAVILFNACHVTVAGILLLVFATTGYLRRSPGLFIVLAIIGAAAIPDVWLKRRIDRRKRNIEHALPDAMDLAVVSVEAGLGLDQTLLRVGDEIRIPHPDLADELQVRNLEVNMGRSRSDAFRNLADRTGVEDLKALVAILIQTDRFGTSVGQALRTFSESLRIKRKQRAEEQAAKLAIKMIVPMVLFIFPAVFIVILGPPMIAIIRELLPMLAGQ
jgi:tight adherence protein C